MSVNQEKKDFLNIVITYVIEFFAKNKKNVIIGVSSVVAVFLIVIGSIMFYDYQVKQGLIKYETVFEEHEEAMGTLSDDFRAKESAIEDKESEEYTSLQKEFEVKRQKISFETAKKLEELSKDLSIGYAGEFSGYVAAGMYFSMKKYDKAAELYIEYAENSSNNVYKEMALQQAGICYEWLNKNDEALKIYLELEMSDESLAKSRTLYDIARIYQKTNQTEKAKEYFSKVIATDSSSSYAKLSKERLMLLGYKE